MLFSTKKTKIDREQSPESQMKIEITIKIKKTNTTYNQGQIISSVILDENMVLTTDASIKAIKNEVESILGTCYDKTVTQLENSPYLSDEFHKDQAEEEGRRVARLDNGDNI